MKLLKFILPFLFVFPLALFAQFPSMKMIKTTEEIKVDGILDESVWNNPAGAKDFMMHLPYDTTKSLTKTEVWITYDTKNIYIAAKCYDSLPNKNFIIQSLKRDFSYPISDAFAIYLDPINDKTSGFCFGVNPEGAQREGILTDGGRYGVTTSWDNKWFSSVKKSEGFWTVEIAIPFKTIRYKENITEWGINFSRNNLKINENSAWSPVPRQFNIASLPFAGKLIWEEQPPKAGLNYSIIPYVNSAYSENFANNQASEYRNNIGGDAKIAVTSSLNLDVTVNPDFSTVEVDRQVTNLTKFSVLFPEQRQFFIENSDVFSQFGFYTNTPFFSRKIGLKSGSLVPIDAGIRLTGKLSQKWRIGLLDMQTRKVSGLEPNSQNYFVSSVQRQVFANSYISAIFVNKQSFDKVLDPSTSAYNRVAGINFNYISKNNLLKSEIFYHHSINSFSTTNNHSHGIEVDYSKQEFTANLSHEYIGKSYLADVGFTPRLQVFNSNIGKTINKTYYSLIPKFEYKFYPKSNTIIKHGPGIVFSNYYNENNKLTEQTTDIYYNLELKNRSLFSAGYKINKDSLFYDFDITRTGSTPLKADLYHFNNYGISYSSNDRKLLSTVINITNGGFYNGKKFTSDISLKYRYQPWGKFSVNYVFNNLNMPEPYFSGDLHLIGANAELSFSKSVFFSTFFQYNTQQKNININSRFQWRFRPMSDLFIVYTDNYNSANFAIKDRGIIAKFVYWW